MNRIFLITLTLVLSLALTSSISIGISPSYGQQNQTSNTTSTESQQGPQQQLNQTAEIGSASQIENLTAGNIPILGNETDVESQNDTSVIQGMQKEQVTTDTNMTNNQSGGGTTNVSTSAAANQTATGGNQTATGGNQTATGGNQTAKNPLEQIGETLSGIFGGGNQSK